ncbi:hypothetical protein [Erythrobacter sp. YT30]|uniref:hypothetical protein n=1 Tax=Erythrobacter sp. YT30 TaxID=1735012 RepID=UPI00076BD958|nr:hypothetical protein [Erythrobacter sp. YT30]KWV90462.1 hypothetical protein AUC45_14565 [Erythrobacter sp. YT30]
MTDTLAQAIDKASQTQKALVSATAPGKPLDLKELVRLRSQFQHDMLAISNLARADQNLRSDPARFSEFRSRQSEISNELSNHQAKWMMKDIEQNRTDYEIATQSLRASQERFFAWAKNFI